MPLDDGQGVVNFRKLLLTKCQKEFEQDKSSEKKRDDKIKAMKAAKDDVSIMKCVAKGIFSPQFFIHILKKEKFLFKFYTNS